MNAQNADLNLTKPPYHVETMAEIRALDKKGKVASTFSGAGGSSLGYRMAGLNVVWASEFVKEAQETYLANNEGAFLNTSDIRDVTPGQIMREAGVIEGELDMLDGWQ